VARKCIVGATRLDEQEGRARWPTYGFIPGEACTK
jgi:hypothetical protein